jgi:Transposase DDE domain
LKSPRAFARLGGHVLSIEKSRLSGNLGGADGLDARQSDQHQLTPIADAVEANLGRRPTQLSADAGYCSDANLAALEERGVDAYIAPGWAKPAGAGEGSGAHRRAELVLDL